MEQVRQWAGAPGGGASTSGVASQLENILRINTLFRVCGTFKNLGKVEEGIEVQAMNL